MKTLITFGLGALAMYLLDPQQGRRRRAEARDQWMRLQRLVQERAQPRVNTQLEQERESTAAIPQSAQHLGR